MALDVQQVNVSTIHVPVWHVTCTGTFAPESKPEERRELGINIKPKGSLVLTPPISTEIFSYFNFFFFPQTTLWIHVLFSSLISLLSNALTTVFPLL